MELRKKYPLQIITRQQPASDDNGTILSTNDVVTCQYSFRPSDVQTEYNSSLIISNESTKVQMRLNKANQDNSAPNNTSVYNFVGNILQPVAETNKKKTNEYVLIYDPNHKTFILQDVRKSVVDLRLKKF